MYGQYKSIVDCPNCNFESIQFDPFLVCSLPIMNTSKKTMEITFLKDHIYTIKVVVGFETSQKWTMSNVLS